MPAGLQAPGWCVPRSECPGSHASFSLTVSNSQVVVFALTCVSGATPTAATLTVTMPAQTYTVTNDQPDVRVILSAIRPTTRVKITGMIRRHTSLKGVAIFDHPVESAWATGSESRLGERYRNGSSGRRRRLQDPADQPRE